MIVEIAVGTMAGVLGAAVIALAVYRWYRLARDPQTWPRARQYMVIFASIIALAALSWFVVPIAKEQYAESQRQAAIARREADEREYCRTNWSIVVAQATQPDTSPLGAFGRFFRAEYEQRPVGSFGDRCDVRTAHGWLALCKRYGIISQEDFDKAKAFQKSNQDAYDAPELKKRKDAADKLSKWVRGEK